MIRPKGRPPQANAAIKIILTDYDRRRVDQFCRLMNVGYSEFFRLLLAGAFSLAQQEDEQADGPMEAVK
ncbi:hypothetical protein [Modestobacter sp. SYSU DS0290]